MQRYLSFSQAMQRMFGKKVYKLSLDGGMTCPNRDGTVGVGGCIFCDGGSGSFAERFQGDMDGQIAAAKERIAAKAGKDALYLAYFQSYTNTYAPVSRLRELFLPMIEREDICGLSIATRPDCLPDQVLALLEELARIKPVFVELGLQTIHPATAAYIRRGYDLPVYDRAMDALKRIGVHTVVHMIIGLPGESKEDMLATARYIGRSGAEGIKLQLLHILKGTDLAADYAAGKVPVLSQEAYIEILMDCLRVLPPDMVIHRLTGDGEKAKLLAPLWSGDKKRVLAAVSRALELQDVVQGQWWKETEETHGKNGIEIDKTHICV